MNPLSRFWEALGDPWLLIRIIPVPGFLLTFQAMKIFGTLYCNCETVFRAWAGPSILNQAPWSVWLHYQNCYPTGQACAVIAAPYSIFWYIFWAPLSINVLLSNGFLIVMDTTFFLLSWKYKRHWHTFLYQGASLYLMLALPTDMLILWLVFLGFEHPWFLFLAPVFKLPIGAPDYVWQFILSSPYSIHSPENTVRYGMFGLLWLIGLGNWIWYKRPLGDQNAFNRIIQEAIRVAEANTKHSLSPLSSSQSIPDKD